MVRSIIKYFQQVLRKLRRKNPRGLSLCDQSSSTFSRSYQGPDNRRVRQDQVQSIIKYFQQVLPIRTYSHRRINYGSAVNHQVLSAGPTLSASFAVRALPSVRSIIKYFQQVLQDQVVEKVQQGDCAINHQVLSAGPTRHSLQRDRSQGQGCDQSSSTFSRSYNH